MLKDPTHALVGRQGTVLIAVPIIANNLFVRITRTEICRYVGVPVRAPLPTCGRRVAKHQFVIYRRFFDEGQHMSEQSMMSVMTTPWWEILLVHVRVIVNRNP